MKSLSELEALTDDELRVMLAECEGWSHCRILPLAEKDWAVSDVPEFAAIGSRPVGSGGGSCTFPDYVQDLNAVHEVENKLPHSKLYDYDLHLRMANASSARTCDFEAHLDDYAWSRTARQRTIALILTLQKP